MSEKIYAYELADKLLDEPYADPDDDLRVLSRQLLRGREVIGRLEHTLAVNQDETLDLVHANRDTILKKHEEAAQLINKVLIGGGDQNDRDKLIYIGKVLYALNMFHPMHGESWIGWPK